MERDGAHVPFVSSGPYPIRAGNAVRPLVDGEPPDLARADPTTYAS